MPQSFLSSLAPGFGVVPVVTLLAECGEIQKARRLRPVVKHMGRGQNDPAACYWVRLSVLGSAPFALVSCPVVPHKPAPKFPVCRVTCFVLGPYRHLRSNPAVKRIGLTAGRLPLRYLYRAFCGACNSARRILVIETTDSDGGSHPTVFSETHVRAVSTS